MDAIAAWIVNGMLVALSLGLVGVLINDIRLGDR